MIGKLRLPVAAALLIGLAAPLAGETAAGRPAPPPSAPIGGLSEAERQLFAASVGKCWNAGALTGAALTREVTVALNLRPDGTPDTASIRRIAPASGGMPGVAEAYEAARRAIIRCGAAGFDLPDRKYVAWRRVELTFAAAVGTR